MTVSDMNATQMDLSELMDKLGCKFKDEKRLVRALTHSSYANENRGEGLQSNERLEFLGDSILGFITAEYLCKKYKNSPEGELTRMRSALVCEKSLASAAERLGLGDFLRLGRGESTSGGSKRPSILADAMEAVIAAVYLDQGIEAARGIVTRLILTAESPKDMRDYKTILQELAQRKSGGTVKYELKDERGPQHMREFLVEVSINGKAAGEGAGKSKKEAEQNAAKAAIASLFS